MQQLEKYSNTSELEFSLLKMSEADIPINSYSELSLPTYLMCPPFSYSVNEPNNVWMNIASGDQKVVNLSTAFEQWHRLYSYLVNQGAYIHLVHSPKQSGLQDLVFTANAGITLVKEGKPIVVVSNFSSAPRFGETPVLKKNFEAMGYETLVCPYKFEGEADLKHLRDDIYIGSYGIRSDKRAFEWMEQEFGIKVIKLKMTEEVFFHLDCALFNLTEETIITSPDCFSESEFKELEKYCDIESVTITDLLACITTSVKVIILL